MTTLGRILFGLGLGLLAQAGPALAQSGALPDAERRSTQADRGTPGVAPGGTVTVALRELIREKWHTICEPWRFRRADDHQLAAARGVESGRAAVPVPERIPVGPLMNFGYENEVVLLNEITGPPARRRARA